MKKYYQFILACCVSAASLTSCSRAEYSFNTNKPAYLGSERVRASAVESIPEQGPSTTLAISGLTSQESHNTELSARLAVSTVASVSATKAEVSSTTIKAPVQLALVKKVASQIIKAKTKQNAAEVARPASRAGRSALVILAGAVLIVLGGLAGVDIIVSIGGIVFVVGLILLVIALIKGK